MISCVLYQNADHLPSLSSSSSSLSDLSLSFSPLEEALFCISHSLFFDSDDVLLFLLLCFPLLFSPPLYLVSPILCISSPASPFCFVSCFCFLMHPRSLFLLFYCCFFFIISIISCFSFYFSVDRQLSFLSLFDLFIFCNLCDMPTVCRK